MKPPAKIQVPLKRFNRLINHGPCTLVTTHDGKKANVATIAWNMPCGRKPPSVALCIGSGSYTHEVLRQTKELVINVPGPELIEDLVKCGSTSGRDVDKFSQYWLSPKSARTVKPPWVAEALAHLECVLVDDFEPFADRFNIFVAEVKAAFVQEGCFENDRWLVERCAPTVHHLGGPHFVVPGKLYEQD